MINLSEGQLHESRLAEYKELAQNFRTLTDIRFKLLSFLPVGTALVGLFTALGKGVISKGEISVPLSLFGLAITLALIVYNERNDQLYDELVARAAQLERLLGLPDGQFSHRPQPWLKIRPIPETPNTEFAVTIEHRWPIEIIYRASIIAWLFMLFFPIFGWLAKILLVATPDFAGPLSSLFAGITAFSVGKLFLDWFKAQRTSRRKTMREQAKEAVERLAALKFSQPEEADLEAWEMIFTRAAELRGGTTRKESDEEFNEEFATVLQWARFYLSDDLMRSKNNIYYPIPPLASGGFGETTAAYVIGLLTDLPPRWLIDVHSGRRGSKEETEDEKKQSDWTKLIEWLEETTGDERVDPAEQADRAYWERKSHPKSLAIMDKIISLLRNGGVEPKLTYYRHRIAMGITGYNFCWFQPRKTPDHCHMEFRVEAEARDAILLSLLNKGIDAFPRRTHNVSFSITTEGLADNSTTIIGALKAAEMSIR